MLQISAKINRVHLQRRRQMQLGRLSVGAVAENWRLSTRSVVNLALSQFIDLHSPTCGSKAKQKYTHVNTVNYNKQKTKKNKKSNEQVFMALCKLKYVQYYHINIIATLTSIKLSSLPCNFTANIRRTWKFIFERCRTFCPKSAWYLEIEILLTSFNHIQIISFEQFHEETVDNKVKRRQVWCH